jgi:hypothetical protein
MICFKAGATSPTGRKKWFLFYCIVFVVTAVLVVQLTEPGVAVSENKVAASVSENLVRPNVTVPAEDISFLDVIFEEPPVEDDTEELSEINDPETLYYPMIVKASERYQVDPLLVKAMIVVESGFDPNAVSHVGAQGLMQLMPSTARALGVEDSFNPAHNIEGGVKYFKKLLDRFNGDVRLALAAYNAGSRKVRKYRGVPPFTETQNYIEKVFKLHTDFKKTETRPIKNVLLSQS